MNPITLIFCSWLSTETFSDGSISQLGRMASDGERGLHMLYFSVPIFSFLPYSSVVPAQMQVWKETEELIWVWPHWNKQLNCPWFSWCSSAWFSLSFKVLGTSVNQIPGTTSWGALSWWWVEEHSAADSHWEMSLCDLLGTSEQQQEGWDKGAGEHPTWCGHSGVLHPPPVAEQGLKSYSACVCGSCSGLKGFVW